MPQTQELTINFAQGLDTKTDPWQLSPGKFLLLQNVVFTVGDLLTKRNGYGFLAGSVPPSSYLTTLSGNLVSIGTTINAYNQSNQTWSSKGALQPCSVSTLPLVRNNLNQTYCDSVIAPNGLVCTAYSESNGSSLSAKYVVADSVTGQNIIAPTVIPNQNATYNSAKVFVLGAYFVLVYTKSDSTLVYLTISISDPTITSSGPISSSYSPSTTVNFDGVVFSNNLYIAWNGAGSSGIKMAFISSVLVVSSTVIVDASHSSTIMTVSADIQNNVVWASYYNSGSSTGYSLAVDSQLALLPSYPVSIIGGGTVLNIISASQSGINTVFYEISNTSSGVQTNFVERVNIAQSTASLDYIESIRSVGLASKAFIVGDSIYYLATYSSTFQPTYFLIDGSTSSSASPIIVAKIAYQNGRGYLTTGVPSALVNNGVANIAYLYKDDVEALNTLNNTQQTMAGGIYSQLGINLSSFDIETQNIDSQEIARDLHLSGGFLGMFDGFYPVEHNFFLFPEPIQATWSSTGGSVHAQPDGSTNTNAYFYQVTYEWTDMQGNAFKSAPSIPVSVTTTGSGTAGSISVVIPTLRITEKVVNPVKIVIYRWSVANPAYFQTTSITAPTLNDTTVDTVTKVDINADASIVGNNLLYTTGGVVADTNGPASNILTLFDTRLWLVDAEDPNLLWVSKTVIENVPVEMSTNFTIYVAPNIGTTQSSGPMTALAPMDDKIIIFKKNSIFYINGTGPDNLGTTAPGCSLGNYSPPTFVTSVVGSVNQKSIVLTQDGLMFQSDKGIWLLGRDLSTSYIGAPVEAFNKSVVNSANVIPGTNYVVFTLDTGEMLMYDYYYKQWGTFVGAPAISSCIYNGLHTLLGKYGEALQETPGQYLDAGNPVLINFTTSWLNLAGIVGYERFYEFYILARYLSPHTLQVGVAYDYNPSLFHSSTIKPKNFSPAIPGPFGITTPVGSPGDVEPWRIHAKKQLCTSFQITVQEVFDSSFGVTPGGGLTMSGIHCEIGLKKSRRPLRGANSVG